VVFVVHVCQSIDGSSSAELEKPRLTIEFQAKEIENLKVQIVQLQKINSLLEKG
jgi:hypothetical protein